MNNRHGEYSHCLQWLAIGIKFPGEAADAYAVSGYFAARYAPDDSPVYIWQWLADCFPPDLQSNATACSRPNATETICSNSYRTPQIITDYLVRNPRGALKDNFVSHYLVRRYVERGWLRTDPDPSRKKGELRSLHGNAQALAEEKKAAGGFTNSTRAGDTGKARWVRTEDPVPKAVDKIRTVQVEFHGRKGVF